jgi:hypothetical protein
MKKLIAGLLFIPCMASAEFMDGNGLLSKINDVEFLPKMVALGYVQGVADVYAGTKICMPKNVTAGQARDVVKQYLEINPEKRHYSADSLVLNALAQVWPCANRGGTRL